MAADMTRAELVSALRERFARLRSGFPDIVAVSRYVSGGRLLEAYASCGACGQFHVQPAELVELAWQVATIDEWLPRAQALCVQRFPERCRKKLEAFEALIQEESPS